MPAPGNSRKSFIINEDGVFGRDNDSWREGLAEVARLLLEKGAKADAKDKNGKTPADLAEKTGKKDLVDMLQK